MTQTCENIKSQLVDMKGKGLSDKAKLVALLEACGMTDIEELQDILECKPSTLREARRALKFQRQKSITAGNPAPEFQHERQKSSETPEIQRQNSSALARANKESPSEIVISEKQQQQPERKVVDANELHAKLIKAAGAALNPLSVGLEICAEPLGWINGGADLDLDIIPVVAAISKTTRPGIVNAWKYYRNGVIQARDARLAGLPPPVKPAQSADVLPFKVTTAMNVKPRLDPPMVAAHA